MQKTKRLSRSIILSFFLLGAAITLMLSLSLVIALQTIEINILDEILQAELKQFRQQASDTPQSGLSQSRSTIVIYSAPSTETDNIPEYLRNLPNGIHDVTYNGRDYRVLVDDIGGMRYTIKFDDTSVHQREREFIRLVLVCAFITLMMAFIFGSAMAHYVISPIKRLAYQVMAFKNQPGEHLDLSEFGNDEIGVLAHKLQHYHQQLQQLLIREKEFASNVSHELRTPVTSISMAAEVLATKKDLSGVEYERIKRIQRAAAEMSELIETFLVLAQINTESTDIACYDMAPIVRDVIDQQRVWLSNKPIDVIVEEKDTLAVSAPFGILRVLVANLVRNAFRYTERGSVVVTLSSGQLAVTDTGVGIDSEIQAQLFKSSTALSFNKSDRIRLGLSIVQRICERYGWAVSFESKKGQGTRFTINFISSGARKDEVLKA